MEVKFILSYLLVTSFSNRPSVSVLPELLPIYCANCTCVSSNGAKLPFSTFSSPIQVIHGKSVYQFPACVYESVCINNNTTSLVCTNDTSNSVYNSEGVMLKSWLDPMAHSLVLQFNAKQLRTVIVSCQPKQQSTDDDDTIEFIVTDSTVCKYLEDFISAASLHSSPVLLLGSSLTPLKTRTPSLSSTTTSVASTAHSAITNTTITPSNTSTPESPEDNGGYKLLYIVVPIAAPVAFIIAFITVFCLMHWYHQRTKKKLYIKLTPTIYTDEDDGQDSDDSD
ncbi:uncharacterized protein [Dysidea avara]|uniref:uncharacterized protein isoform X2 n=1 Tax=Dysidea avara TaxID=196820 RepID=UPI003332DB7E